MIKWPDPKFEIENECFYDQIHVGHNGLNTNKEYLWADAGRSDAGWSDASSLLTEKLLQEMIDDTATFLSDLQILKSKLRKLKND